MTSLGQPEEIISFTDASIGLEAVLVIDHTGLGPAAGGIRTKTYGAFEQAVEDAKRLARAMTLKCSLAGLNAGGGKMVVRLHENSNRPAIFRRLGKEIQKLGGRFHSAGDFGTTDEDLAWVNGETEYLHTDTENLVHAVARGHLRCVEVCLGLSKDDSLSKKTIAVQGCGDIGSAIIQCLHDAGATIRIGDIDSSRTQPWLQFPNIYDEPPETILKSDVDLIAPCAIGGVVNSELISQLETTFICGAANNLLSAPGVGSELVKAGIVIVPDFVSSAGAVVDGIGESVMGLEDRSALIDGLAATAKRIMNEAKQTKRCPYVVGEAVALQRIHHA